ncbi:MAG: hypothetical protein MUO85_01180 [candidate division Zixibacteria bacterium]|nr:hypothetical protein [candidate division Zixibacteria bacterium]
MQKLVDTSSSFYATGIPPQAKIFRISSGQYVDRVIAIYPQSASAIVFRWADPPYTTWSSAVNIVTDSADYPAEAYMDSGFNVYLAYTVQTSLDLAEVKLSFSGGEWSVGTINTICNQGENYYPTFFKDVLNRLWVVWDYYNPSNQYHYIYVKKSANDGVTWGTGPDDLGTCLNTPSDAACYARLVFSSPKLYCFFTDDRNELVYSWIYLTTLIWSDLVIVYSGPNMDDQFHVAVSSDGKLGVVFPGTSSLLYKEFDGIKWSDPFTVDSSTSGISPSVKFFHTVPYVFYSKNIGTNQNVLSYSYKTESYFEDPQPLNSAAKTFDKLFCYDHSAATKYNNKTTEASNTTPADVFHLTSNALVKDVEDCLYLGMSSRFNLCRMILSTAGVGGEVVWEYWNGTQWYGFTPNSGVYHLDSTNKLVILWSDGNSIPSDWQQCTVNLETKFWVRIKVTTNYTTAPVGTQVTAAPESKYIVLA